MHLHGGLGAPRLSDKIRNLWRENPSIENRGDDVGQYARKQLQLYSGK